MEKHEATIRNISFPWEKTYPTKHTKPLPP
jgi:hypothetical protein